MVDQDVLKVQPPNAWVAQVLRLTAYYSQDQEFDLPSWWAELAGASPEKDTKDLKTATRTVEGPSGSGRLILQKNPLVINLSYQPDAHALCKIDGIPAVGYFDAAYRDFLSLAKKLLSIESFCPVKRLAFGLTLNLPAENLEQALRQLAPYTKGVTIDAANSRDFMYRINRRRRSTGDVPDLYINRLSTWQTVAYHSVMAGPAATPATTSAPQHACQLELDMNTAQEFAGPLPVDKLKTIFEELASMGTEIIEKGDIE